MKKEITLAQSIVGFNRFHEYGLSRICLSMLNQAEAINKAYVYMNFDTYQKVLAIRNAYRELANEPDKHTNQIPPNPWGMANNVSSIEVKLRSMWGLEATDIFKHTNAYEKFKSHGFWDLYMERNNKIIPNPIVCWDFVSRWENEGRTHLYASNLQKYFDTNQSNVFKLAPLLPAMRHFGYWNEQHEAQIVKAMEKLDSNTKQRYFAHQSFNTVSMRPKSVMSFVKETINSGDYWTLVLADWNNEHYLPRVKSIIQAFVVDYRLNRSSKFRYLDRKINILGSDCANVMKYIKDQGNRTMWSIVMDTHKQCDTIENLSSSVYDYFQFIMKDGVSIENEVGILF